MELKNVHVAARIPKAVYARLLRAQKNLKRKTRFEVTISEMVRRAIEHTYP
jgi:TFIIF-interacting CTD phosphatase-like protein